MNESKVIPERVTGLPESWMMFSGAVVNVGSVANVAVPPPLGTTPATQFAGLLQFPPAVPTSAAQVPLVCPRACRANPADTIATATDDVAKLSAPRARDRPVRYVLLDTRV